MESKLNVFSGVFSDKFRRKLRYKINSENPQKSKSYESLSSGAFLQGSNSLIKCSKSSFSRIEKYLAKSRQNCIPAFLLKELYAQFFFHLTHGVA